MIKREHLLPGHVTKFHPILDCLAIRAERDSIPGACKIYEQLLLSLHSAALQRGMGFLFRADTERGLAISGTLLRAQFIDSRLKTSTCAIFRTLGHANKI
jgi:hypothetical protein